MSDRSAAYVIDESVLPPRVGYERATPIYCFARSTTRLIATLAWDLKAYDAKNVPLEGGVLLVANHQSFMDPAIVASKLPRKLSFLARSGLFEPLGFGWLIRQLNAFPVKQGKGDVGAMKQSIVLLQEGNALLMFPEGGRTPDGKLQEIAAGASLVVKRARVPVVPVGIVGAFDAWPRHHLFPRTGRVRMKFGRPLDFNDVDGREIVQVIGSEFARLIREIHELEPRSFAERAS